VDRREGGPEGSQPGVMGAEDEGMRINHDRGPRRQPFGGGAMELGPESYQDDDQEDDGPVVIRSR
jgi:hypothetical protein